ncbi:hypothetical protein GCM10010912_60080 [Paenibacillus albidus]|uniref:Uncharacterized protein n=1 Tax=Paenibacillus albidus TaxID=2041023 RepID=A0A917D2R9_9BACL|nr:hypothetical protein GCM10010912_60080 [Paenibacillus albidus]
MIQLLKKRNAHIIPGRRANSVGKSLFTGYCSPLSLSTIEIEAEQISKGRGVSHGR